MLTLNFKRGDTFRLDGTYMEDGEAAALPTGIRSQLRDANGNLITELTVTRTDADHGLYSLSCSDSSGWIAGRLLFGDVQFTNASGVVVSTETFTVNVQADQTHD
jgi:hypothetical protein